MFACRVLFVIILKMIVDVVIIIEFIFSSKAQITSDVAWRRPTVTCCVLSPAL